MKKTLTLAATDLRTALAAAIGQWFNYFAPGDDPQPTARERREGAADAVLAVLAEHAWIVPKIDHDETVGVKPIVRSGRLITRAEGASDPEHTRYYAAQLLAAADHAETLVVES